MDKDFAAMQKEKLIEMKNKVEDQLKSFATKDEGIDHNWKSHFPKMDKSAIGDANLESAQDEVEEYMNRLSLEHTLEIKLRNIEHAIERVDNKGYGKCDKCGKPIPKNRLEVCPEASLCLNCDKK